MRWESDSNILLRSVQLDHPMHQSTVDAVSFLLKKGETLHILPQNVREFWNVCTRPKDKNGLGMTHQRAQQEVENLELFFDVLEDGLPVYRKWREIVVSHRVMGVQVHDAYIVAAMLIHGITHILTFNTDDFTRYADLDGVMNFDDANIFLLMSTSICSECLLNRSSPLWRTDPTPQRR